MSLTLSTNVAGGVHVAAQSTLGREFCKQRGAATDMTAGTTVDPKLGCVLRALGPVSRALRPVSRVLWPLDVNK